MYLQLVTSTVGLYPLQNSSGGGKHNDDQRALLSIGSSYKRTWTDRPFTSNGYTTNYNELPRHKMESIKAPTEYQTSPAG